MRYPEFLKSGGRIGFIAPSFGEATEPYKSLFEAALKRFTDMGYRTVLGPNCYADFGIGKSNTPEKCGEEINDFFLNDRSDVIISCGGGETMCEDLPFVDFDAIKKAKPKWFMGYSDNTNLTFTLPVLTDTAAVYAPCAASFGTNPVHPAVMDAFKVLTGEKCSVSNYDKWEIEDLPDEPENLYKPYNVTEPFKLRSFIGDEEETDTGNPIHFSGRLLGGCMDCLSMLAGTKFDKVEQFADRYADDGIIWFLEACDLNVMSIRRVLWQLEQNGWFKYVNGFLIGRPRLYNDAWGDFDHIAAAQSILGQYGVPIIHDLDIGHLPPMMPIISGAVGYVCVEGNSFKMEYIFE